MDRHEEMDYAGGKVCVVGNNEKKDTDASNGGEGGV